MSPAGSPPTSERGVLEQPLPAIAPCQGLDNPLLGDAVQMMDEPSMAEYVLLLHHESNKQTVEGLPLGPNEQEVFDFYWETIGQQGHNAVMLPLYTVFDDAERDVFITLHSDRSALLWQKLAKDSYAPVPQPFFLDLSQVERLGLLPWMFEYLVDTDRGLSLSGYLTKHWDLDHDTPGPKPFKGEIGLKGALEAEARQWIAWLPQALPVPCLSLNIPPADREILYPWLHSIDTMSFDEREALEDLLTDFLYTMWIIEDVPEISSDLQGGVSVMRALNRQGKIEKPTVYIGWGGDLKEDAETLDLWQKALADILDHPDCPVPKIAQLRQNMTISNCRNNDLPRIYDRTSLAWLTQRIDTHRSGHELMECLARIQAYGIPLPSKRSRIVGGENEPMASV
jgi:hypothetical protein